MKLDLYQIDAFANTVFTGNPAAICPLESWLADDVLLRIAAENNLSETAFFIPSTDGFHIRWFTPLTEVALCGHATLASAYVLFEFLGYTQQLIHFESKSGPLTVSRNDDLLTLNFPSQPATQCSPPENLLNAFPTKPILILKSEDYIFVFENEQDVLNATPNLEKLKENDLRGVIITAPSKQYDFVCRFFAPNCGIDEDPVTGSAYTQLYPYWSDILNKTKMHAHQVSKRGGDVWLDQNQDRVLISGKAVLYMRGEINI